MIQKERLVQLTQHVLSMNSENPPGNEYELGRFIEKDCRSLGLDVKIHTFRPKRPNIIATLKGTLPRARAQREALLLTPHYDTVPIGQGWKRDPLGEVVGSKIYGRGASDDKGNLAACMEVMRSLVEDGYRPQRDIIMAATADEETGSHHGILPLLQKKVLRPGFALVVDSEDFNTIVSQKGLMHLRIQIHGKKAHGAYNWLGESAIEMASRIIVKLKKHKFRFKKHKMLHPPTVNIGMIRGGDKVNIVSDFCEFAVDTRFLPGMDHREILKSYEAVIRTEAKKFMIVIDDVQQPYEIDPAHPVVQAYLEKARKLRCPAQLKGSEGATVITFFQNVGIPAISTGFGASGTMHSTDEYIRIPTLYKGARLLEEFVKDYDGIPL